MRSSKSNHDTNKNKPQRSLQRPNLKGSAFWLAEKIQAQYENEIVLPIDRENALAPYKGKKFIDKSLGTVHTGAPKND